MANVDKLFDLTGKTAVVTGGGGVLGGDIAAGLASAGATVAIADVALENAEKKAEAIGAAGGKAKAFKLDVFDKGSIQACCDAVCGGFGQIDILVNAVGGNMKAATTSTEMSFFDLPGEAVQKVVDLNLVGGTIVPCQVFGARMKDNPDGASIINISSMNALRPLTRIPGYSAAKAAVSNFTQWLAVHLAQECSTKLRVNAIAPGFFLTDQNRFLLTDEKTGDLTRARPDHHQPHAHGRVRQARRPHRRGRLARVGRGPVCDGIVVPIDGGFSAFSGV